MWFYIVTLQQQSQRLGWVDIDRYGAFQYRHEAEQWIAEESRDLIKGHRFIVQVVTAVQKIQVEAP